MHIYACLLIINAYRDLHEPMIEENGVKTKGSSEYLVIWPYYIICEDEHFDKKFSKKAKTVVKYVDSNGFMIACNKICQIIYHQDMSWWADISMTTKEIK